MSKQETTHVNTGIRKILEDPRVYDLWRNLISGKNNRSKRDDKYFGVLGEGDKLLDIGCGTGALLDHLNPGVEYHGFDMEESYIESLNIKYKGKGKFYCERVGEVMREEWKDYFTAVNAHGLIHHLSDEDSLSLFEAAKYYMKPGAFFVTVDSVYHDGQSKLSKWIVSKDRGQNIRTPQQYIDLAKKYFSKVESELVTDHLRIPHSIFVMKCIK